MRRVVTLGGYSLVMVLLVNLATPSAEAAKKLGADEQAVVLLKLYHNYFEEGKYQQAELAAELAHELAPEDPETVAAVRIARRLQNLTPPSVNIEQTNVVQKLDKVLNKLEQLEKQVHDLELQKASLERQVRVLRTQNQHSSRTPRQEPLGSPDRID